MKITSIGATALMLSALVISGSASSNAGAQTARARPKIQTNTAASYQYAYQHGYRAGYEDGFERGKGDFAATRARDYRGNDAYTRADRGYRENLGGSLPEFQEGYRIGFEVAYNDGYYGRPYSISMPTNLGRAVVATMNANRSNYPASGANANSYPSDSRPDSRADTRTRTTDGRYEDRNNDRRSDDRDYRNSPDGRVNNNPPPQPAGRGGLIVRSDMSMKVRLNTGIDTKTGREGDSFTAVVLDGEYADAEVTGHIAKLSRSGKASGKTELSLAFDSIRLRDGRAGRFNAQVERVYESETVKTVDEEGNVESSSRTKDTATRGVGGAALGAIIGGIAGGGKGAAIGAVLGGGAGVGSVYVQDGKSLRLEPGTEMLIRTTGPSER